MGQHDWYRNSTWSSDIKNAFETKLNRARKKNQYLRIQACYLVKTHPEAAHQLLDKYFNLEEDKFDEASAYGHRAEAYITQKNLPSAISAYESAIESSKTRKGIITFAWLELSYLIAEQKIEEKYNRAIELLQTSDTSHVIFATLVFKLNAAMALILQSKGERQIATNAAKTALNAAQINHSGFNHHPTVGLVQDINPSVISALQKISTQE